MKMKLIQTAAKKPIARMIVAHGAGAPATHPWMNTLATKLAEVGIEVFRFNFPYIEKGRKAPGSPKEAQEAWMEAIAQVDKKSGPPLFLAGKSYGGRMGSHLLSEYDYPDVKGIIYFGFPLHAPGKPGIDRAAHLKDIDCPQLFIQGTKDSLADIKLMRKVAGKLPEGTLVEIPEGDHSLKRKGVPEPAGLAAVAGFVSAWIK
jgi:predicted alpha/beta-hydrolase family hydrolase